jgi:endo-1,4-beta-xylanase
VIRRRTITVTVLILAVLLLLLAGCAGESGQASEAGESTAQVAATPAEPAYSIPADKYLGNIWAYNTRNDPIFPRYWNQVTAENGGKWEYLERERDQMVLGDLDRAYAFADQHGYAIRHHTLVWGNQQPTWIADLSPEEQLAELTEMMTTIAERYPSIDYIDVVNEPLHAPPPYKEALGGDGETGWDWVITSFEMAREYFPNAQLNINDYSILPRDDQTTRYIEIIQLLQERGLIDGIGIQGHFIERADIDVMSANLDRIAATGLPIYVTELDVDIENDIVQALQFRGLFTMFWEHPSVRGVTLWGYIQGRLWRTNAWLLSSGGQPRLSMDWLVSYMNGDPIELPSVETVARRGDDDSIKVEAEDFDSVEGIDGCGSFICYVDGGDQAVYERVAFRPSYRFLTVRYGKGNAGPNAMHVRLGSADAEDTAVVDLTDTGGWNTFADVKVEWPEVDGTQDMYLVFDGGEGVGNIDYLLFSNE